MKDPNRHLDNVIADLHAPTEPEPNAPIQRKRMNGHASASAAKPGHNGPPLEAVMMADFGKRPPRQPLIENVAALNTLEQSYGQPEAGKSVLELHKSLCLATGTPFGPFDIVEPGGTLWLALEDGDSVEERVFGWCAHYGITGPLPFALVDCPLDLRTNELDTNRIIDLFSRTDEQFRKQFDLPAVRIVVDTYILSLAAGDPNSGKDSGAWQINAKKIVRATRGSLSAINHAGKDDARGASGTNFLRGAMDFEYHISQPTDGKIRVENTKNRPFGKWRKDGKRFAIGFEIVEQEYKHPMTGERLTAPVVVAKDQPPTSARALRTSPANNIAREALRASIDKFAKAYDGKDAVRIDMFRKFAFDGGVSASSNVQSKQKAFKRACDALVDAGEISIDDGWCWFNE